ncbi:MAG: metalloregulator ArsR/SmtB family transcription factor [Acidobacteriota bacterium]
MRKPSEAQLHTLRLIVNAAKAMGHPVRLRILAMLHSGPLCVCQMTAVLGLAASTVSGHLAELRRADLVAERKQGKWVEYSLVRDGPAASLIGPALDALAPDVQIRLDAELVRRLRAVPLETLCVVGVDLKTPQGVRRVGGRPETARKAAGRT